MEKQETKPIEAPPTPVKATPKVVPAGDPRQADIQKLEVTNPGIIARKVPIPTNCAKCGDRLIREPGTIPFSTGPYKGGFLCKDCIYIHWDETPEILADAKTRAWVSAEARRIRLKRAGEGSELLFEQGPNRAFLTPRGTVIIDLERLPFGGPDEFDPDRFKTLAALLEAVCQKVPVYCANPQQS